jgi:DNA-binding NtrC family response regulator
VATAKDGPEALAYYTKNCRDIDLVILDVVMPHMSGEDCFHEMKRIRPDLKVLLTTAYDRNAGVNRLLERPDCWFLAKPYRLSQLRSAVAIALGSH